jgi:hypothetical protein
MSSLAAVQHVTTLLAVDDTKVTPGILGFVIFAALGIGTWWILKAMNRSLRRVDFVEQPPESAGSVEAAQSVESAEKV